MAEYVVKVVDSRPIVKVTAPGPQGAAGPGAAPGLSAYELALVNGYVGSETAWLASLQGSQGARFQPAYPGAATSGFTRSYEPGYWTGGSGVLRFVFVRTGPTAGTSYVRLVDAAGTVKVTVTVTATQNTWTAYSSTAVDLASGLYFWEYNVNTGASIADVKVVPA